MKFINFTCKEKLQSLLDKSCSQTIRKAWKVIADVSCIDDKRIYPEPAKFKVGDKVNLVWDKDSISDWFCRKCGEKIIATGPVWVCSNNKMICGTCADVLGEEDSNMFNKNLGTVEITEVFKVEISLKGIFIPPVNNHPIAIDLYDFAKRDGFKSLPDLHDYLDKQYGLKQAKEFWVYRWKYV